MLGINLLTAKFANSCSPPSTFEVASFCVLGLCGCFLFSAPKRTILEGRKEREERYIGKNVEKRAENELDARLTDVALAEELHSHHSEDEDDDTEDKGEVAESAHRLPHDRYQQVERRPGFGQFEDTELKE